MTGPKGKGTGRKVRPGRQNKVGTDEAEPVHLGQEFALYLESKAKPLKVPVE